MFMHFTFENGSNPYITTKPQKFFEMIRNYQIEQTGEKSYHVTGEAEYWTCNIHKKLTAREKAKTALREFAIIWQNDFDRFNYSFSDLLEYQTFFEEYGRKYGLLCEFRENGIC